MYLLSVVNEENQIPTLFWWYEVATLLRAVVVWALVASQLYAILQSLVLAMKSLVLTTL